MIMPKYAAEQEHVDATLEQLHAFLGVNDVILETLTASQASRVIEAWK